MKLKRLCASSCRRLSPDPPRSFKTCVRGMKVMKGIKNTGGETVVCVSDLCFRLVKSSFVATSSNKPASVSVREALGLWTRFSGPKRWRPGGEKHQNGPGSCERGQRNRTLVGESVTK